MKLIKDYLNNRKLNKKYEHIIESSISKIAYERAQLQHKFKDIEGLKSMILESDVLKEIMLKSSSQTPFINELKRCLWMFGVSSSSLIKLSKVRTYEELIKIIKEVK